MIYELNSQIPEFRQGINTLKPTSGVCSANIQFHEAKNIVWGLSPCGQYVAGGIYEIFKLEYEPKFLHENGYTCGDTVTTYPTLHKNHKLVIWRDGEIINYPDLPPGRSDIDDWWLSDWNPDNSSVISSQQIISGRLAFFNNEAYNTDPNLKYHWLFGNGREPIRRENEQLLGVNVEGIWVGTRQGSAIIGSNPANMSNVATPGPDGMQFVAAGEAYAINAGGSFLTRPETDRFSQMFATLPAGHQHLLHYKDPATGTLRKWQWNDLLAKRYDAQGNEIPGDYTITMVHAMNDHHVATATVIHNPTGQTKQALLVPVQIEARKQGTTAAPETGLLVKKGDVLEFALAPQFFDTEDNFESLITWQYRQLKSDGTYTGWTDFGSNGTGTKFQHTTTESGIFQIKVTVQNAREHFHVRRKSDPHTSGDHELKKGDPDSIGVADTQIQIDIVAAARTDLGSTAYAVNVANGFFEEGTNKCNLFVAEKAQAAGATVPFINFEILPLPPHSLPPVANQWAGIAPDAKHPAYTIANWDLLSDSAFPQPGLIVASGSETWSPGHAGIVDYDGRWISAGPANVNRNAEFKDYKIRTLTGSTRPAGKRKYTKN
jgi:hypothetical protein